MNAIPYSKHLRSAAIIILAFVTGCTDRVKLPEEIEAQLPEKIDFQATLLYLMGVDHEKLTYKHQGRRFRLTDVAGRVIHDVLV